MENQPSEQSYMIASAKVRFINYLFDVGVCVPVFSFIIGAIFGLLGLGSFIDNGSIWFGFFLIVVYYVFFESLWQRTPGKFLTKTKVVNMDGTKPTFGQIVGRSFARIIPFEPFSFFRKYPRGWHDTLPHTLVVPAHYSAEEVKKIDVEGMKKIKGFNVLIFVIVILLIISIVGIISAVILSSIQPSPTPNSQSSSVSQ